MRFIRLKETNIIHKDVSRIGYREFVFIKGIFIYS